MTEILANKKAYNARKKELIENGYVKSREYGNSESFCKKWDEVKLVAGWKSK